MANEMNDYGQPQPTPVPPEQPAPLNDTPYPYEIADQTPYAPMPDPVPQPTDQMPYPSAPAPDPEPESGGSSGGWIAAIIIGIIIIVGIVVWFFVVPHPESEETAVESEVATDVSENPDAGVDVDVPEGAVSGIGSNGPLSMTNPNGAVWDATVTDLPSIIELHGVADNGVTLAFVPDDSPKIDCRIVSVQLGGQTYMAGDPNSPLHIEITAGASGARDITSDPTFDIGSSENGAYGQRVLISIEGKSEADYNGMVVTIDETPEGGETVSGTVSLESRS